MMWSLEVVSSFLLILLLQSPFQHSTNTVKPLYNEDLGTLKITLLYQVSHIRVKKTKKYKELGPAKLPCYNRVLLYIRPFITRFHCMSITTVIVAVDIVFPFLMVCNRNKINAICWWTINSEIFPLCKIHNWFTHFCYSKTKVLKYEF